MAKSDVLHKLSELRELQRKMDDIAKELGIGDIDEDKIYIAITSYHAVLEKVLREEFTLNSKGD